MATAAAPQPGITRKRKGRSWAYFTPDGDRVTEREEIDRLNAIGLPPAYTDCWFNPDPDGELQATGYDAAGRRQYRYHTGFRLAQDSQKYDRLRGFGEALPKLRAHVEKDLACKEITCDRAVASVVRVLDLGALRVGNEKYRKANGTFGAATLRMKHVKVQGTRIRLRFLAKGGKQRELTLSDRSLLRFVKAMGDLPGQHLFQYLDVNGEPCPVGSSDINAYIKQTMGEEFSAKDFRTWAASAKAFSAIATTRERLTPRKLAEIAAEHLSNTPAIARKSYIHPAIMSLADDAEAVAAVRAVRLPRRTRWLSREERGLLDFLEQAPPAEQLLVAATA